MHAGETFNRFTDFRPVAPSGFCNVGGVRYGSIGGLEYEVPQSRLYCLCIDVALCSTALQCICRVIQRSSMTMKAHTYYIILDVHPYGGERKLPPSPLAAPLFSAVNCTRIRLAAGPAGGAIALSQTPVAVIRERGGTEGEGKGWE